MFGDGSGAPRAPSVAAGAKPAERRVDAEPRLSLHLQKGKSEVALKLRVRDLELVTPGIRLAGALFASASSDVCVNGISTIEQHPV